MPRHDLDFVCVAITPHEADAESTVDSDAVLCVPATFERLQAVAWEDGQRNVFGHQLSPRIRHNDSNSLDNRGHGHVD
jgi:hypothetical protein